MDMNRMCMDGITLLMFEVRSLRFEVSRLTFCLKMKANLNSHSRCINFEPQTSNL